MSQLRLKASIRQIVSVLMTSLLLREGGAAWKRTPKESADGVWQAAGVVERKDAGWDATTCPEANR